MRLSHQLFDPASSHTPLYYIDTHADADAAPPSSVAVFVHAFPLGSGMWLNQLQACPPGWRFIAPSLRGFDATEEWVHPDGDVSVDDYADDVLGLLTGLGIERAAVVGLSLGGYVAFAMLRKAAARISALLLADTRATADTEQAREARLAMLRRAAHDGPGAWLADEMIPKLLSPHTLQHRPEVASAVRQMIGRQTLQPVRGAIQRMLTRPDSTPDLVRITVPTAIVVGADDAMTPVAEARAMHQAIAGSMLEIIPEAGHLSNLEQPTDFNGALSRLLARVA